VVAEVAVEEQDKMLHLLVILSQAVVEVVAVVEHLLLEHFY
jgi:hypothetical protein